MATDSSTVDPIPADTSVPEVSVQENGSFISADERKDLSKVLFPDTHTNKVSVLGKEREVRPLPIKYGKQINELLNPIADKIGKAITTPTEEKPLEGSDVPHSEMVEALQKVADILATFYHWEDVKLAIAEEELTVTELQSLAFVQMEVSGSNDFLLSGLRLIVKALQMQEVLVLKFQNLLTGLPSAIPFISDSKS